MEDVVRIPGRAFVHGSVVVFALALSGPVVAVGSAASFPAPLQGVWEPYLPCDTGETSDSDSRFEITRSQRLNYEEIEDIVSAELLTESPLTWRIVTTSDVGPPELEQPFIYVLKDDRLAVNDGQSARMYARCK